MCCYKYRKYWSCWKRSWRGHEWLLVDLQTGPRQLEAPPILPILEMYFCPLFPQWELWDHLNSMWLNSAKVKVKVKSLSPVWLFSISLSGSSVHGIFQARVLEWIAISFSGGSSQLRNQTWVSCIANRFFTDWAMRETRIFLLLTNHQVQSAWFHQDGG